MSYPLTTREAHADALMSDDTLRDEMKAQELVNGAKELLIEAARRSSLNGSQIHDALDTLPNLSDWNTEISLARRYAR